MSTASNDFLTTDIITYFRLDFLILTLLPTAGVSDENGEKKNLRNQKDQESPSPLALTSKNFMKTKIRNDGRGPSDDAGPLQLFTDEEHQHLLLVAMGRSGATEEQLKFVDLCERMRVDALLLENILRDPVMVVGYNDEDEPYFARKNP